MKLRILIINFLIFYSKFCAEMLSDSACLITQNVLANEPWMKTISIVNFWTDAKNDVIENLHKCLPETVTKVLLEVKDKEEFDKMRIHNPVFNILIFNKIVKNHDQKLKIIGVSIDLDIPS